MKAALVRAAGEKPVYAEFEPPVAAPSERIVHVSAAALSHLARMRASGQHYSSAGAFPFAAGVDGVGRLDDGQRVYFVLPRAPFGAMAERVAVAEAQIVRLPDGLDDVTAAALANPAMSSWAAFVERARLQPGETVLINGATGSSGQLAVRIAKHFGAARVIATGRNRAALAALELAPDDEIIVLDGDAAALEQAFAPVFARGVDVVLDYLWGPSARAALIAAAKAGPEGKRLRFVQIGSVSGGEIALPAAVLRASAIELMGSGIGSVPLEHLVAAIKGALDAAAEHGWTLPTRAVPLAQVAEAWDAEDGSRVVFTVAR